MVIWIQSKDALLLFIFPLQEDSRFTDEMNCSRSLDMHRFRDIIGLVNDLLGSCEIPVMGRSRNLSCES